MWRSACLAVGAMVAILAWWAAVVHVHYKSDFTRLFVIGTDWKMPVELESLEPAKIAGPGYDGQWYLLMTMDPFMAKGFDRRMDDGRLRYRRILIPLLAHFAACGKAERAPMAFCLVTLLMLGLGVYWSSRYAMDRQLSCWWGLRSFYCQGRYLL